MENDIFQLQYALDTFYFLVCGALVMWMAAGFAMLEAGLVRSKNTVEILTKNVRFVCGRQHHVHGVWLQHHVRRRHVLLSTITGSGVVEGGRLCQLCPLCRLLFSGGLCCHRDVHRVRCRR